jgi:GNAT superfamily N-acetyltransferase
MPHVTTADRPYLITAHDPAEATDGEIAEGCAFANILQAEVVPGDPPTPVEEAIAASRAVPDRVRRFEFHARDDEGGLVGRATTMIDPDHDDNPDLIQVEIDVLPEHRRRGLAGRLLAELTTLARTEGRRRFHLLTNERVPAGAAFARAIGGEPKLHFHTNHLVLTDVDRAQLEGWVADAPRRSAEYELFGWDGPCPDEYLDDWVDMVLVMNTAPRDDLAMNDFTFTAEMAREFERQDAAKGNEAWTLVARRRDDGTWAGFHDVHYRPSVPTVVWVGATGVRPEHRGSALGKWLKAAMTLRVIDERPQAGEIRTGNADSNAAMLGINHAMGYRPFMAWTVWELPVDAAEAWLRVRTAAATPTSATPTT